MITIDPNQITEWNASLRQHSPQEITQWAIAQGVGRTIVSTNFRPYEAVILHLATRAQADIPVLWADHGFNRPTTYRHADQLQKLLNLNIKAYVPRMTSAHYEALHGAPPSPENEAALKEFSSIFKLEPFRRGMQELAPRIWITALRKVQNPNRAGLDIVSLDPNFGTLKVSPVFYLTDAEMEQYLKQYNLPNEWDYFDPAKADEKRECGLHVAWGGKALS
jgi:phosphoadenosine phosphosulfate reductase